MPLLDTRQLQNFTLVPVLNVARETAEVGSRWGDAFFFCTSVVHTYRTYIVAKQGLGAHRKKLKGKMAPRSLQLDRQTRNLHYLLEYHVAHAALGSCWTDREKEQELMQQVLTTEA